MTGDSGLDDVHRTLFRFHKAQNISQLRNMYNEIKDLHVYQNIKLGLTTKIMLQIILYP